MATPILALLAEPLILQAPPNKGSLAKEAYSLLRHTPAGMIPVKREDS